MMQLLKRFEEDSLDDGDPLETDEDDLASRFEDLDIGEFVLSHQCGHVH